MSSAVQACRPDRQMPFAYTETPTYIGFKARATIPIHRTIYGGYAEAIMSVEGFLILKQHPFYPPHYESESRPTRFTS